MISRNYAIEINASDTGVLTLGPIGACRIENWEAVEIELEQPEVVECAPLRGWGPWTEHMAVREPASGEIRHYLVLLAGERHDELGRQLGVTTAELADLAEANETIKRLRNTRDPMCARCQDEGCAAPEIRCVCCCCGADLPEEPTE